MKHERAIQVIEARIAEIRTEQRELLMAINRIDREPFFGGKKDEMNTMRAKYIRLNNRKLELNLVLSELNKEPLQELTLVS